MLNAVFFIVNYCYAEFRSADHSYTENHCAYFLCYAELRDADCRYTENHCAQCRIFSVMLIVIVLNVVAPRNFILYYTKMPCSTP